MFSRAIRSIGVALVFGLGVSSFAVSFFAHAESVSLHCHGQEMAPGNTGRQGEVNIVATKNSDQWVMQVNWQGDNQVLVGPGVSCGVQVPAAATCSVVETNSAPVFKLWQICGAGDFDTRGLPHHMFDAEFVLDSMNHGRFYCAAHDAKVYSNIELSDCQEN